MKKLTVLFLAFLMVLSAVACGGNGKDVQTSDGGDGTTDDVTSVNDSKPDLPDISFNGASYRVSTRADALAYEVFADETASDIRQQALWERNVEVQDTYDVVITPLTTADTSFYGHVIELGQYLHVAEDMYDIALTYAGASAGLVTNGYVVNWLNLKYNDLSKVYWLNDVNKNLLFDDAIYLAVGEMSITTLLNTYAMFMNRTETDKIKLDGGVSMTDTVFDTINNDSWTIDYFHSLIADIYYDIDDEQGRSKNDFYGFTAEALTNLDVWQFAFDIHMVVQDETDGLKCVFNSEKTAVMVDKLNELYWETNGSYIGGTCTKAFVQGNVLFHTTWLGNCFTLLSNMEEDYTILPYPMFDEDQGKYLSGVMDNYNVLSVPYTCTNLDMVSVVTEALNYESKERLFPVYYEKSLQSQYSRDPETIAMLDIVMSGRTFDLGTIFSGSLGHLGALVRSAVSKKNNDFSKLYESQEWIISNGIEKILEQYNLNKIVGKE